MGMRKDTLITIIMGVISIFTSCNPHPNLSKADQLINFYHDTVDKYGNKKDTKVYSLVLCEDELSKVNWNNIDSSMLSDLGEEYINPVIFR